MVSPQILQELKSRSQTRVENSEYFVKERRKIDRYLEKQAQATVTLNREKFLAERAEVNADKDQEEVFESMQEEDRPVFAPTPYNEELTAIALDYLELLGENHLAVAR
jgi:5-formyltetrahydrofolate cyclo-ligase